MFKRLKRLFKRKSNIQYYGRVGSILEVNWDDYSVKEYTGALVEKSSKTVYDIVSDEKGEFIPLTKKEAKLFLLGDGVEL